MFKIDDVKDQRSLLGHSLLAWAPLKNTIQLVSNKIHSKKLDFMVFGKMPLLSHCAHWLEGLPNTSINV